MQFESDRNRRLIEREEMVRTQIKNRGVRDPRVLDALLAVPREWFLPRNVAGQAYHDCALPIECDQTISQPYMVGLMTDLLELISSDRVLEIGTGSGYQTAILSLLAETVFTIECHQALTELARQRLAQLDCKNVVCRIADGSVGWPEYAPYDAIIVTAGAPEVPVSLREQLKTGGRLVVPVGGPMTQTLLKLTRIPTGYDKEESTPCRFVKLVGEEGWKDG